LKKEALIEKTGVEAAVLAHFFSSEEPPESDAVVERYIDNVEA
jgi:hypothetical protein